MDLLDAIEKVLAAVGEPLHYQEITERVLSQGLWQSSGKTPAATVNARLTVDMKDLGSASRFERCAPGTYGLTGATAAKVSSAPVTPAPLVPPAPITATEPPKKTSKLSFTDAAEVVLEKYANQKPMHYKALTQNMLELGLVQTKGLTPEATLYAQVLTENKRRSLRGDPLRFVMQQGGMISLTKWEMDEGVAELVKKHNDEVREQLHSQLHAMPADEFEALIAQLLAKIGFEDVEVTAYTGDGGIDVRGILVVGDVIRTRMAVQAKRWKPNVQSKVVQQVRGSLGAHDRGLIITTSDFSSGARKEAERNDAVPVALMNGQELVDLLIANDIGVKRTSMSIFELTDMNHNDVK